MKIDEKKCCYLKIRRSNKREVLDGIADTLVESRRVAALRAKKEREEAEKARIQQVEKEMHE